MEEKYRKYAEMLLENKATEKAREAQENKGSRTEVKPDYDKELEEILSSQDTPLSADLLTLINNNIKRTDFDKLDLNQKKDFLKKINIDYEQAKQTYKKYPLGSNEQIDFILNDNGDEETFIENIVDCLKKIQKNKNDNKSFKQIYRAFVYSNGSFIIDHMNWDQDKNEVLGNLKNESYVSGTKLLKTFLNLTKIENVLKNIVYDNDSSKLLYMHVNENKKIEKYNNLSKIINVDDLISNLKTKKSEDHITTATMEPSNNKRDFYKLFLDLLIDLMNKSDDCKNAYKIAGSDDKNNKEFIDRIKEYIYAAYKNNPISKSNPFTGQNRFQGIIAALQKRRATNSSNNNPKVNIGSAESKQISDNELQDTTTTGRSDSKNIDVILSIPYINNNSWERNNFLIQLKTTWSTRSKDPVSEIVKFLKNSSVKVPLSNGKETIATTMAVVDGEQWREHLLGEKNKRFISKETNNNSVKALNDSKKILINKTAINFVGQVNIKYCDTSMTVSRGLFTEEFVKYLYTITEKLVLTVNSKKEDFEKNFENSVYTEAQNIEIVRQQETESFKSIVNDFYKAVLVIKNFIQKNNLEGLNIITAALNNLKKIKNKDISQPNYLDKLKEKGITFNYNYSIRTFDDVKNLDRKTLKKEANNIRNRK